MMKAVNLVLLLALVPGPGVAADFSDPDWPCIQRKVENLSAGLMWPHPVTPAPLTPEAEELAAVLALRRVSLEEAEAHIRTFLELVDPVEIRRFLPTELGHFDAIGVDPGRKRDLALRIAGNA